MAIADGGDCVSDLGVLRGQEALFGAVASETTAHRVIKSIDAETLEAIRVARAKARERAWDAGARPEELILDIDATLLGAHSEKERAAGTYKNGFGFFPLLYFLDETSEPLAGRDDGLRSEEREELRRLREVAVRQRVRERSVERSFGAGR